MNSETTNTTPAHRHYWLREDFDHLMGLLPSAELGTPGANTSGMSLFYPKHTEGAVAELRIRGLKCDGELLTQLAEQGIVKPGRGHSMVTTEDGQVTTMPSSRILYWSKEDIDAAAEYLDGQHAWLPSAGFCFAGNLRFGQVVKAYRVAAARFGLAFCTNFDLTQVVTVIEPGEGDDEYAWVRFLPKGTKLEGSK